MKNISYSKAIGGYFCCLGWLSITWLIISIATFFWTDALQIDFTFIIWFWLGRELKAKNPTARKWTIGISSVVVLILIGAMVMGVGNAHLGSMSFAPSELGYYLVFAVLFFLLGLPGLLLLSKSAKDEFGEPPILEVSPHPGE